MQYAEVQSIAKKTIEFIKEHIHPGMTLLEVRKLCESKMLELGADSFWYWGVGAFVFAGDETTLSVSGKEYITSERVISENDIITILETILNATSNVMYFCTAGKDRTGVVSALLLKRLGASEDVIVEDYMKSKENLLDMLTTYVKNHPEVDIDIIIPQEENIRKVLSQM